MDFHKLYERYNETKQYKDRWLGLYKDLYFFVIPDRDAMNVKFNYNDNGKPVTAMVWDSTAMLAAYQRANDLHGLLLPKDRVWGSLSLDPHIFPDEVINESQETMDEINDRIFYYINESNLSRVVSSSNLDLIGGTGAIWVESPSDNEPLYFRSIPSVALYIEYSNDDVVNTCWYQCKKTGRQVLQEFPKYQGIQKRALVESPNEEFTVIYGQIKEAFGRFYLYAILEIDPFYPLWEADRSYNQIIIYRDKVRPGEADGRGPGLDLLPTIRDLNRMVEYRNKAYALKAFPPLFYDADAYFNPYSMRQWAGSLIARQPQGRNPIEALQIPDYPDTLSTIQDLRDVVQKGFQVDPLGEINTPVKSATEISIREQRAQRTSATDISRLINEQPKQIYEICAKILSERNLLTKDRAVRLSFEKNTFHFQYKSPLYDAQKQDDLNHFITNMQVKQQFFGQGAAMTTVNLAAVNEFLTDRLNLPHDLFVSKEQLQQYIQQAGQMAQQGALPTPSTTAAPVKFPDQPNVTI